TAPPPLELFRRRRPPRMGSRWSVWMNHKLLSSPRRSDEPQPRCRNPRRGDSASSCSSRHGQPPPPPPYVRRRVHLVFHMHLDAAFFTDAAPIGAVHDQGDIPLTC
ncbi:Os01g0179901, partial [Oryza sativa Japonica Group]